MVAKVQPLFERVFKKVEVADCWYWLGTIQPNGYGKININGQNKLAHRFMWTYLVGPIPKDYQIDHLCKVKSCVNPDHLQPVTSQENIRRSSVAVAARNNFRLQAVCKNGHIRSSTNTKITNGYKRCLDCHYTWKAKRNNATQL